MAGVKLQWVLLAAAVAVAGCDESSGGRDGLGAVPPDDGCVGSKCDSSEQESPEVDPELGYYCEDRHAEDESQELPSTGTISWECDDLQGVKAWPTEERGREACEYYAILGPLGSNAPIAIGRVEYGLDSELPLEICEEEYTEGRDCVMEVTEEDIFQLEDYPDAVVGQCVFTAWLPDGDFATKTCDEGCTDDTGVHGFPLDAENFRMRRPSNGSDEVVAPMEDCAALAADAMDAPDLRAGKRPGLEAAKYACYEYGNRDTRSTYARCAAGYQMEACGCRDAVGQRADYESALAQSPVTLGAWNGPGILPAGCQYASTDEQVVVCDLTAAEVLDNLADVKDACRERYAWSVRVHYALPERIECDPPAGAEALCSRYATGE